MSNIPAAKSTRRSKALAPIMLARTSGGQCTLRQRDAQNLLINDAWRTWLGTKNVAADLRCFKTVSHAADAEIYSLFEKFVYEPVTWGVSYGTET